MAENERAFREVAFRPRMATRADVPDLTTTVLGTEVSLPLLLAPCGLAHLMHPDGALGAARAAKRFGTVSVLSTVAGTPPEGLADEPGPRWFQLYAADRRIAAALIHRAASSGFEGLVVTVDTPALGKRERDARNGWAGSSLKLDLRTMSRLGPQIAVRPRWTIRMLGRTVRTLRQPTSPTRVPDSQDRSGASDPSPTDTGALDPTETSRVSAAAPTKAVASAGAVAMLASPFAWDDIAWMRERWTGSLLVKGVLSGDDALRAADAGADAVIVSNHGGRQLEGAPASLRVLPEVVEAAGNRLEVLLDGGVRRGGDVAKAVALGARAVLIGRPYLYALSCGRRGRRGTHARDISDGIEQDAHLDGLSLSVRSGPHVAPRAGRPGLNSVSSVAPRSRWYGALGFAPGSVHWATRTILPSLPPASNRS